MKFFLQAQEIKINIAKAGFFHVRDVNAVRAAFLIDGDAPPNQDRHPVRRHKREPAGDGSEHDSADFRKLVLQGKIKMTARDPQVGYLALDMDIFQVRVGIEFIGKVAVQGANG